jgi:hypothetical protein
MVAEGGLVTKRPTFDADGYPTDETVDTVRSWPADDPRGAVRYVIAAWNMVYGQVRLSRKTITLVTGGWSGNESLISSLSRSVFGIQHYREWKRGGLHVFDRPRQLRFRKGQPANASRPQLNDSPPAGMGGLPGG